MSYAPIAIFAYKRPEHLDRTLKALAANAEIAHSTVYFFIDGLKPNATAHDHALHARTVAIAENWRAAANTEMHVSPHNKGLAASIEHGVNYVLQQHTTIIVLEDDLETSPVFLSFMNEALERYAREERVSCISGYTYPLQKTPQGSFFLYGADCWGWATWRHQWKLFRNEPAALLEALEADALKAHFTFNNSYPYMEMLRDRKEGRNQSWAILWYASVFLERRLCLYPPVSLVQNIGNDGSGTHTLAADGAFEVALTHQLPAWPETIADNAEGRRAFEVFFRSRKKVSRIKSLLQRIWK